MPYFQHLPSIPRVNSHPAALTACEEYFQMHAALASWDHHKTNHKLNGLINRNLFFQSSGGQKSKTKVSAGPCSLQGHQAGFFLLLPTYGSPWHSLACDCITLTSASSSHGLFLFVSQNSPFFIFLTRTFLVCLIIEIPKIKWMSQQLPSWV